MSNDTAKLASTSGQQQVLEEHNLSKNYEQLIKKAAQKEKNTLIEQQRLALSIYEFCEKNNWQKFRRWDFYSFLRADVKTVGCGRRSRTISEVSTDKDTDGQCKTKKFRTEPKVTLSMLLNAILNAEDDLVCWLITYLYISFSNCCPQKLKQRRMRAFIKLGATKIIAKTLSSKLSDDSWKSDVNRREAIVQLSYALTVTNKDRLFTTRIKETGFYEHFGKKLIDRDFCWHVRKVLPHLKATIRLKHVADSLVTEDFSRSFNAIVKDLNADILRIIVPSNHNHQPLWNPEGDPQPLLKDRIEFLGEYLTFALCFFRSEIHLDKWVSSDIVNTIYAVFYLHLEKCANQQFLRTAITAASCLRLLSNYPLALLQYKTKDKRSLMESAVRDLHEIIKNLGDQTDKKLVKDFIELQESVSAVYVRLLRTESFPFDDLDSPVLRFSLSHLLEHNATLLPDGADLLNTSNNTSDYTSDDEAVEQELKILGSTNARVVSDDENANDSEDEISDDGDADGSIIGLPEAISTPVKKNSNAPNTALNITKSNNLLFIDLKSGYKHFFSEFEDGCSSPRSESEHNESLSKMMLKSVGKFVKVAYPQEQEKHCNRQQDGDKAAKVTALALSNAMMEEIGNKFATKRELVFDLDELIAKGISERSPIHRSYDKTKPLQFESRFESGNLRKAYRVGGSKSNHYELILSPDIGTRNPHYQWFYFEVSNNERNVKYTFDIVNCFKSSSMYSRGMQPVVFSRSRYEKDNIGWTRLGSSICYYRNRYTCEKSTVVNKIKKSEKDNTMRETAKDVISLRNHYTLRFQMSFDEEGDTFYIAYHYPFTYSSLKGSLENVLLGMGGSERNKFYIRNDILTTTVGGNAVPLITITGLGTKTEIAKREIVFITARVHPGESNASWMMNGVLQYLTSSTEIWTVDELRKQFVFKIIPMLNPDGVINGNHRCSLAGRDLNRVWKSPSKSLFPSIYSTKALVQYSVDVLHKVPFVYVDFHGHSREMNVFLYGNNPLTSKKRADRKLIDEKEAKSFSVLPERLNKLANGFRLQQCKYTITEKKSGSARIALWRDFCIPRCYTMESTYFGFSGSEKKGVTQITLNELEKMGQFLCDAILQVKQKADTLDESEIIENGNTTFESPNGNTL